MKVSIAWIFDHINADWRTIGIEKLVKKFNQTTAEIEGWYEIKTEIKNLTAAQVQNVGASITLYSPEWHKTISLSGRGDCREGAWHLIKKTGNSFKWALSTDLGAQKEMILPALHLSAKDQKGGWKKQFETKDYILEVDNKSITHRPDLWGHRGFAREIAAMFDKKLKPFDQFLAKYPIKKFDKKAGGTKESPFNFVIQSDHTNRFAGLYIPEISYTPSLLWMVSRLSRVDSRAIDALVDSTNYVMLDTSQPMHAFDADQLTNNTLCARQAESKEKLTLLDDQTLELDKHDIVIADAKGAVSLAGIMGGKGSGISSRTKALLLESAHFDAATIRKTSQKYKVRSEASARFEKSLDPDQNVDAILRYLQLLNDAKISYKGAKYISSLGKEAKPLSVTVSHQFIEDRIGVLLDSKFIMRTLEKLAFKVKATKKGGDISYRITIPLFRATKDIALQEDIVEEIARFYGYSTIKPVLPLLQAAPTNMHAVDQVAHIKHMLAFGLSMHELYGYALFNESFIKDINYVVPETLNVKDPVSENWYRLMSSLLPNLIKAVHDNHVHHDELRFFEWGRIWECSKQVVERKSLAGIFYHKKPINFYDAKAELQKFFAMLSLKVDWELAQEIPQGFSPSHTAQLLYKGKKIGIAGLLDASFLKIDGTAFAFELDGDFLEQFKAPLHTFKPLSKYPSAERDISMMVPLAVTVEELSSLILKANKAIVSVFLIDFFQKKEWNDKKSLAFRYVVRDDKRTLTKQEVDAVSAQVAHAVETVGASIR